MAGWLQAAQKQQGRGSLTQPAVSASVTSPCGGECICPPRTNASIFVVNRRDCPTYHVRLTMNVALGFLKHRSYYIRPVPEKIPNSRAAPVGAPPTYLSSQISIHVFLSPLNPIRFPTVSFVFVSSNPYARRVAFSIFPTRNSQQLSKQLT